MFDVVNVVLVVDDGVFVVEDVFIVSVNNVVGVDFVVNVVVVVDDGDVVVVAGFVFNIAVVDIIVVGFDVDKVVRFVLTSAGSVCI